MDERIKIVDPERPYKPPRWGLFHENKTLLGARGEYSVYIPSEVYPAASAILLLPPDGVCSKTFSENEEGKKWRETADQYGIILYILEAEDGKSWNINQIAGKRNEAEFIRQVLMTAGNRSSRMEAPANVSDSAVYIVGYKGGAAVANMCAMSWPAYFAGLVSIEDEGRITEEAIHKIGSRYCSPFIQSLRFEGKEYNALPNSQVPVSAWIIGKRNPALETYWITADKALEAGENVHAITYTNPENRAKRVWITENERKVAPRMIFKEFLNDVHRFAGEPGGHLRIAETFENDGVHGFFSFEEKVNGYLRRWLTYIPKSYKGDMEVALVIAIHGYSSSSFSFSESSRWQDVSEKYGFITVFPMAYPMYGGYGAADNIPVPCWNNYSLPNYQKDGPDDVEFIRRVIFRTKERFRIDAARIYATGHSNGSAMVWMLGLDAPELFTAIAPVGFNPGSARNVIVDTDYILPVNIVKVEWESNGGDQILEENFNGVAVGFWSIRNGANCRPHYSTSRKGVYSIRTTEFKSVDGAPLVRFDGISNAPHAYFPEIAWRIWEDFFAGYRRDAEGTLFFNDKKVKKAVDNPAKWHTDIRGHKYEKQICQVVFSGLMHGNTNNAFDPDADATCSAMLAALGRMEENAVKNRFFKIESEAVGECLSRYINWAKDRGIITDEESQEFKSGNPLTVKQLLLYLRRYFCGSDVIVKEKLAFLEQKLERLGIPETVVTRAGLAAVLYDVLLYIVQKEFDAAVRTL